MNSRVTIRICRFTFLNGHRCQGPAVHGRSCCRHHLTACLRLHKMARARRRIRPLRFVIPESPIDLARNHAEVRRAIATGRISPGGAKAMQWALQISAAASRLEQGAGLPLPVLGRRNPNGFYYVPTNHLSSNGCVKNPPQLLENTKGEVEGVQRRHSQQR